MEKIPNLLRGPRWKNRVKAEIIAEGLRRVEYFRGWK
jgi:hypothetical protein